MLTRCLYLEVRLFPPGCFCLSWKLEQIVSTYFIPAADALVHVSLDIIYILSCHLNTSTGAVLWGTSGAVSVYTQQGALPRHPLTFKFKWNIFSKPQLHNSELMLD